MGDTPEVQEVNIDFNNNIHFVEINAKQNIFLGLGTSNVFLFIRDGTDTLLSDLNKAGVPVLVFSAGLGDTVVAVLKHCNVLLSNVKVKLEIISR